AEPLLVAGVCAGSPGPPRFVLRADDGIRLATVTGVQTCALPISSPYRSTGRRAVEGSVHRVGRSAGKMDVLWRLPSHTKLLFYKIGRASCRERVEICVAADSVQKTRKDERSSGRGEQTQKTADCK